MNLDKNTRRESFFHREKTGQEINRRLIFSIRTSLDKLTSFAKDFNELKDLSRIQLISHTIYFFINKYAEFDKLPLSDYKIPPYRELMKIYIDKDALAQLESFAENFNELKNLGRTRLFSLVCNFFIKNYSKFELVYVGKSFEKEEFIESFQKTKEHSQ